MKPFFKGRSLIIKIQVHDHLRRARVSSTTLTHTGLKVLHSRRAQKPECGIFSLGVKKNSMRSTAVKFASPHLVFITLAFGSGGNLHELWTVEVFSP